MNEYREDDALIQMAMEELPMSNEMPQNLKSKLTDRALENKRKTRTARRPWMVGAMTCGLAVLALGAFFIMPKPALGRTWSMISDAVNQVQTFQLTVHSKRDGEANSNNPENVRIAVSGNKVLVDAGGEGIVFMDGDTIQCYEKNENKIMRIKLPGSGLGQMVSGVMSGLSKSFDLKKEFARYEQQYGKDHIRIQPVRSRDGRDVYDVIMTAPEGSETVNMTIDAETNLPTDIFATENKNGKREETTITLRYNDAIVIEPHFPANAKYEDLDISKLGDMKGFDGEKLGKQIETSIKEGFGNMGKHEGGISFKM